MRQLHAFAWSGLCSALAVLCVAVWLMPVEWQIALRWRADLWLDQPWTLWSASLTHLSDLHLVVNLVALLCLAVIGQQIGAKPSDALALVIAWPVTTLALLLWPQIQFYAGFSGLNHALAGVLIARGAIDLVVLKRFSIIIFLLAPMLVAKLIWETPWSQPLQTDASWGFAVVQAAHLTGFVCGLLLAFVVAGVVDRVRALHANTQAAVQHTASQRF